MTVRADYLARCHDFRDSSAPITTKVGGARACERTAAVC